MYPGRGLAARQCKDRAELDLRDHCEVGGCRRTCERGVSGGQVGPTEQILKEKAVQGRMSSSHAEFEGTLWQWVLGWMGLRIPGEVQELWQSGREEDSWSPTACVQILGGPSYLLLAVWPQARCFIALCFSSSSLAATW